MFSLNPQQAKLLGAFAIAASGPVTAILVKKFGLAPEDVKMYFDLLAAFTLLLGGGFGVSLATNSAQISNVAAMPPEQQVQVVAAMPTETKVAAAASLPIEAKVAAISDLTPREAVQIATALPDVATLAAVNAMPDVNKVITKDNASDGVGEAMRDSTLKKVVPQSQAEDGNS